MLETLMYANKSEIPKLFGTSGIRGVVGKELTHEMLLNVGRAVAAGLRPSSNVLVATDSRVSREFVKAAVSMGLLTGGANVIDAGILPTPILAFATVDMGMDAGIMITASHNPPEYNGVKLFTSEGIGYSTGQENEVERIYAEKFFRDVISDNYKKENGIVARYTQYLLSQFKQNKKTPHFRIAVDPGNGAASGIASKIFSAFGYTVMPINDTPDGTFPGRSPEPKKDTLENTWQFLKDNRLDLAVCFDGDADRVVFVDKDGFIGFTESVAFLCALAVKRSGKKKVVATVETGKLLDNALADLGVEVVRGKVGDVSVAHLVREIDAAIGIESIGVYIMPELGLYPNSIAAALTLLSSVQDISEIRDFFRKVPPLYLGQRKIPCANGKKEALKQMIISNPGAFGSGADNILDGLRMDFGSSWILVRPSGTEPIFRIIAESPSEAETERLLEKADKTLRKIVGI
jgi:phosphoglucosamine mutase